MVKPNVFHLGIQHSTYFNYSFRLNGYGFLTEIIFQDIQNDLENVRLEINSSIGLFEKYQFSMDQLKADSKFQISNFDFKFNLILLKRLTEKDIDSVAVEVFSNEISIYTTNFEIDVLPIDYFGGLNNYPQLLVSYILSNHPAIYQIKNDAIKVLEDNNMTPSFEGYQSNDRERVLQMVSALYKSVQNLELIYSALPPSFESSGQRIRLFNQIIETKFGNCLDITLLFAACLEAIDLNPIIIFTSGHAFVGVWLNDQRFESMVNYDQAAISKRIASGMKDITLIESTNLCKGSNVSFKNAGDHAEVELMHASKFLLSIDVKNARSNGILPLPFLKNENINQEFSLKFNPENNIQQDYEIGEIYEDLELVDQTDLTKQKVWERKLLDLSLRNNLLNIRFTKSMLQLVDLKINLLEDNLADGKSYTINPNNNQPLLRKYNLYNEPLHPSQPLFQLAEDELKYSRVLTYYHNDDLDTILTHLYRSAKLAEEENGKSTLYLGVGLLKWFDPKNKDVARFAPILLIPVELTRKSVNTKFTLRSREEETMINITLLEYLRQEYKLNLSGLETLPTDDFGVDVSKVLAIVRNAVLNLQGWDVLEQTVLGTFSFNKLILWQDISKYSEEILKSDIVKSLIDGKLSENLVSEDNTDDDLETLSASELTLPISTDNSQLKAVRNAHQNKTFILHGPPGTGKSQTITNIIADALANNKKVLFVAAKKAALDVVHHRLEKIGLGPFCLELHSNKSKKSDVLRQFERTLETPKYLSDSDFSHDANRIDERKKELNKMVNELHKKFATGWSLYDSISYLEKHEVKIKDVFIVNFDVEKTDISTWNNWKDWIIPFSSVTKKIGQISEHPLRFISIKKHQYENKNLVNTAINEYLDLLKHVTDYSQKQDLYLYNISGNIALLKEFENIDLHFTLIDFYFNENQRAILKNWLSQQDQKQNTEVEINKNFNLGIYNLNYQTLSLVWNQSKYSWFLPKWLNQRKVKKQLNGFAKSKIVSENQVDVILYQLNEIKSLKDQLSQSQFSEINYLGNKYLNGNLINTAEIEKELTNIKNIDDLAKKASIKDIHQWTKRRANDSEFILNVSQNIALFQQFETARQKLDLYLYEIPTTEELLNIKKNINLLEDWVNYNHFKENGNVLNLNWFISIFEKDLLDPQNTEEEFENIIHLNYFVKTVYGSEILNGFDANIYESLVNQYKKLHQEFTELSKNQLIVKLSNQIPNFSQEAIQSSEIGILQRAIRNKGRGLSLRKLFDQIPVLLPKLKPCMLMSPISVAQYFDVSADHFDLVIFDEASQLPTSEAISALARAKQAIIVGDPKQMPPTSFFASSKIDEDNMELEDLESILDDCLALSIPSNYLLRHYRSKHESLISFSNTHFYDSKLLTFPSYDDLSKKVTFKFVGGFYDKGKTRTNKFEAESIVTYIKNHLETGNKKTLGVVTFSQTQQSLVEDLLQKLFQKHPKLEEIARYLEEPIFIKNLENVQGDERDIILFSICYGPDEEGKVSMNFGPLNRDGGWRRLNVAITRSRFEMKVFSSLKGDQIDLNRTKSEGVKGLKNFLNYAEKGSINLIKNQAENQKYSLVNTIAKHLESNGLEVKHHIGTSEYKVDLGILNPKDPNEYILAILIDGENYYNIKTTNDRELLAPNVLKSLGWNVYRIWTLDWLKNKDEIVAEIKTLIENIQSKKAILIEEENEEVRIKKIDLVQLEENNFKLKILPYVSAEINIISGANSESIYFFENRAVLLDQFAEIIKIEAPISQNALSKKVLKLWNTSRAGGKLNAYLQEIILSIPNLRTTENYQKFYWSENIQPENLDNYRDNMVEKRNIDEIAYEEIAVAIMEIMRNNLSLNKEELIKATSRVFGFLKVGSLIENTLKYCIDRLVQENVLREIDGRIFL